MCQTEAEDLTDYSSDEDTQNDDIVIRARWTMDGATTIDEAVEKLDGYIEYLKSLKEEGWELREPVNDDWGFLQKSATVT
jgi:hypothetical protein